MKVASTVQSYEGEPRASNEDFDEDWQRRFLACGVQVKIRTKKLLLLNFFSLLRLCYVFYGEIYVKNVTKFFVSSLEFRCCRVIS